MGSFAQVQYFFNGNALVLANSQPIIAFCGLVVAIVFIVIALIIAIRLSPESAKTAARAILPMVSGGPGPVRTIPFAPSEISHGPTRRTYNYWTLTFMLAALGLLAALAVTSMLAVQMAAYYQNLSLAAGPEPAPGASALTSGPAPLQFAIAPRQPSAQSNQGWTAPIATAISWVVVGICIAVIVGMLGHLLLHRWRRVEKLFAGDSWDFVKFVIFDVFAAVLVSCVTNILGGGSTNSFLLGLAVAAFLLLVDIRGQFIVARQELREVSEINKALANPKLKDHIGRVAHSYCEIEKDERLHPHRLRFFTPRARERMKMFEEEFNALEFGEMTVGPEENQRWSRIRFEATRHTIHATSPVEKFYFWRTPLGKDYLDLNIQAITGNWNSDASQFHHVMDQKSEEGATPAENPQSAAEVATDEVAANPNEGKAAPPKAPTAASPGLDEKSTCHRRHRHTPSCISIDRVFTFGMTPSSVEKDVFEKEHCFMQLWEVVHEQIQEGVAVYMSQTRVRGDIAIFDEDFYSVWQFVNMPGAKDVAPQTMWSRRPHHIHEARCLWNILQSEWRAITGWTDFVDFFNEFFADNVKENPALNKLARKIPPGTEQTPE